MSKKIKQTKQAPWKVSEGAIRAIKSVGADLNVPGKMAVELIIAGNKKAIQLSRKAYKKYRIESQ